MLGDKRFIRTIQLKNFLSYGPESEEIELKSLNVLIGPNASGKSNFIEALNVLRNTPKDIAKPIREGGGIGEYLWKGSKNTPVAEINLNINYPNNPVPLRHVLRFSRVEQRFELIYESIEDGCSPNSDESGVIWYYRNENGSADLMISPKVPIGDQRHAFSEEKPDLKQSILSQRKEPRIYPELTYIADHYSRISIFKEWTVGGREPEHTDLPDDYLMESSQNLGMVLNDLQQNIKIWENLREQLKKIYDQSENITTKVYGNTVQILFHEKDLKEPIPATRLSDGTLRYLTLLAILCHPTPPPLICFEEPELGLHPDILSDIAELLIEASHRTQLIVTTHSDILVSALSEVPESVLVCERDEQGTNMRRLEKEKLEEWLKKYTLGDLWMSGELGGTAY